MRKTCSSCTIEFKISDADELFYQRMEVPPPSLCFTCRMQRRLAHRNERFLYHRKCSLSGKQIISHFAPERPFPVADIDVWWGDSWDAIEHGVEVDFSRAFFEQFVALRNRVPRLALQQQRPMENSRYCNCASRNKNCYLVFASNNCEECSYGSWVNHCRDCSDVQNVDSCELCYECVNCRECYNLRYSRDCTRCSDSFFLRDCIACRDCFGCTSLAQAHDCLFNEHVGKERYRAFVADFNRASFASVEAQRSRIESSLGVPCVREFHGVRVENCSGEYLRNSRNLHCCFEIDQGEDLRYCMCLNDAKDCMDYSYWGQHAELLYECQACGYNLRQMRFCNLCWSDCGELDYCDHCFSSTRCFGCVGLKRKQNCILNRAYARHEFDQLKARLIAHMRATGEWGEFFPIAASPFAYNESIAHEHAPISRAEALKRGWLWQERDDEKKSAYLGADAPLPDDAGAADLGLCERILRCQVTGRPYKITKPELAFYQRERIPLPRVCPDVRHARRVQLKNPRFLWPRRCHDCAREIMTPYAPARPEKVLCAQCYEALRR